MHNIVQKYTKQECIEYQKIRGNSISVWRCEGIVNGEAKVFYELVYPGDHVRRYLDKCPHLDVVDTSMNVWKDMCNDSE